MKILPTYYRVKKDLKKYKPEWYAEMAVTDIATWLHKFYESSDIVSLFIESYAERKTAKYMWDKSYSVKICQAAYVALDPVIVERIAIDPELQALMELVTMDIAKFRIEQREQVKTLANTLKALLPRYPYNRIGGSK